MAEQTTVECMKDQAVKVKEFGCNGKAPQAAVAASPNATDLATAITLVNNLKATLIANGICS